MKDKGRGKSKKQRNSSAYTPSPIPTYSHSRDGPKAEYNVPGDDDSNTMFSGRWKIAAGVIFLASVAVTSLGLRSSQKTPDWTPHPPIMTASKTFRLGVLKAIRSMISSIDAQSLATLVA